MSHSDFMRKSCDLKSVSHDLMKFQIYNQNIYDKIVTISNKVVSQQKIIISQQNHDLKSKGFMTKSRMISLESCNFEKIVILWQDVAILGLTVIWNVQCCNIKSEF